MFPSPTAEYCINDESSLLVMTRKQFLINARSNIRSLGIRSLRETILESLARSVKRHNANES